MRTRATPTKKVSHFSQIDPLHVPPDSGRFGRLAAIASESATWFYASPDFDASGAPVELESRNLDDLEEAIEVAHGLLRKVGVNVHPVARADRIQCDRRGFRLVDMFCDRHARKERAFSWKLTSGRTINQRHLLCAMALHQCEQAARAVAGGDAKAVCDLMEDLLELICEVRRALDREAGSTIAARRARQRHAKRDRIKNRAIELYDRQEWRSTRNAASTLFAQVLAFSREIGAPLTTDTGRLTLYKWLREHRNSMRAQQA